MKYYAKLSYKGKVVGYRYEHKGNFYDVESNRKSLLRIKEENDINLELIPYETYLIVAEDKINNKFSEDLTDNLNKFYELCNEDKKELELKRKAEDEISKAKSEVATTLNDTVTKSVPNENKVNTKVDNATQSKKEYKLANKPTKKKVQTYKGVGVTILGVGLSTFDGIMSKRYMCLISVTSKTAVTNLNKILGAKFNAKARLKDFEKGVTEFKIELTDILLNDLEKQFSVVPCLSQSKGLLIKYHTYNSNKEVVGEVKSKMRVTDFALPKKMDIVELEGADITLGYYRDLIFSYCDTGKYTVLADL